MNLLDRLFANTLYPTGLEFKVTPCAVEESILTDQGCVLMIPGRYWNPETIQSMVDGMPWVLAMRTSDEEDEFDITKVEHPHIRWWVQNPRVGKDYGDAYLIGCGFPPHFNDMYPSPPPAEYMYEVFLSAQDNHERRHRCFAALDSRADTKYTLLKKTTGFTQGMSRETYCAAMQMAKIAPAPAGIYTPDTFRVFEALETHTIPIADDVSPDPDYDSTGFWRTLFSDAPFPILTEYESLPGWIEDLLADWPYNANRITAWWIRRKREMASRLRHDLRVLGTL